MRNMIFGPVPDFGDILARLARLQEEWEEVDSSVQ